MGSPGISDSSRRIEELDREWQNFKARSTSREREAAAYGSSEEFESFMQAHEKARARPGKNPLKGIEEDPLEWRPSENKSALTGKLSRKEFLDLEFPIHSDSKRTPASYSQRHWTHLQLRLALAHHNPPEPVKKTRNLPAAKGPRPRGSASARMTSVESPAVFRAPSFRQEAPPEFDTVKKVPDSSPVKRTPNGKKRDAAAKVGRKVDEILALIEDCETELKINIAQEKEAARKLFDKVLNKLGN